MPSKHERSAVKDQASWRCDPGEGFFAPDAFRSESDRIALLMTDGVTLSTPIKLPVCPLWRCSRGHVGREEGGGIASKRARSCTHKTECLSLPLTPSILLQAMTKMGFVSNKEEEASKCLKEMDLDGDGRVSYAEFMVKWRIT